jgi:hypothetical protein
MGSRRQCKKTLFFDIRWRVCLCQNFRVTLVENHIVTTRPLLLVTLCLWLVFPVFIAVYANWQSVPPFKSNVIKLSRAVMYECW